MTGEIDDQLVNLCLRTGDLLQIGGDGVARPARGDRFIVHERDRVPVVGHYEPLQCVGVRAICELPARAVVSQARACPSGRGERWYQEDEEQHRKELHESRLRASASSFLRSVQTMQPRMRTVPSLPAAAIRSGSCGENATLETLAGSVASMT